MARNPMAYDLPPSMRQEGPPKNERRQALDLVLQTRGQDAKTLLEMSKNHPEVLTNLRNQIEGFLNNGASQEDVANYFKSQGKCSLIIAQITESSPNWQKDLAKLKLPKVN